MDENDKVFVSKSTKKRLEEINKTPEPVVVETKPDFVFDQNTVMFMMYLMFKANLVTRQHLSHFLRIIKETSPTLDIPEYLIKEVNKL